MRHPIGEVSAQVLLILFAGAFSTAQQVTPNDGLAIAREDAHDSPVGDPLQIRYMSRPEERSPVQQLPGYISGTILDQSGAVSAGAEIRLTQEGHNANQEVTAGSSGQFLFANAAPGSFRLTITSPGFATREFSAAVQPGETYLVRPIVLAIATGMTEVYVKVSP